MKASSIYTTKTRAVQMAAAFSKDLQKSSHGFTLKDNRSSSIIQPKKNTTGLPDNLKSRIENLSGHSLDDVKVHYNSSKPAQLNAHAFAKGKNIHLASGQEKHLPHEAWHIVQQKQGRVRPTKTVAGAKINDNVSLEKEADVMGAKALQRKEKTTPTLKRSSFQPVIQYMKSHAQKFIDEHGLGIESTKEAVEAYVKNKKNPFHLRKGLVEAWNKTGARSKRKRSSANLINVPEDLRPTSTKFKTQNDLGGWDSDDEDMLDLSKSINSNKKESMDLERGDSSKNKSDVPVVDIFDGIRYGRQVNKRGDYSHMPFGVNLGGHYIEFDNPGTKDIYATPLSRVERKNKRKRLVKKKGENKKGENKIYKRRGTSREYNWKKLGASLDAQKYKNLKKKQLEIFRFYLKKTKEMNIDGPTAEALGAIGSDLMKGSKGGRFYLHMAIRAIEKSKKDIPFSRLFTGRNPIYAPAAIGGRSLVTKMTSQIQIDANRLLLINNCLINAISRAAFRRKPNLGQVMRIREQIGSYGDMLIASPRIIQIIRQVMNIQNPITIVYQGLPAEHFPGTGNRLYIYHVNGNHFTERAPNVRRKNKKN